jgi:hypothetical protein
MHDNGLFRIPASMFAAMEHTGAGVAKVSDADALAPPAPEPERPVTIDAVLALARQLPVGQDRSILVNKIAEAKLTTPRKMVLAQVAPGTQSLVHAGEAFEVRPGGYVIATAEAADAGDLRIIGAFEPAQS